MYQVHAQRSMTFCRWNPRTQFHVVEVHLAKDSQRPDPVLRCALPMYHFPMLPRNLNQSQPLNPSMHMPYVYIVPAPRVQLYRIHYVLVIVLVLEYICTRSTVL